MINGQVPAVETGTSSQAVDKQIQLINTKLDALTVANWMVFPKTTLTQEG